MAIDPRIPLMGQQINLPEIMQNAQTMRVREMQMRELERKQKQQATLADLLPRAMTGDKDALAGVAATGDPDAYFKIKTHLDSLGKDEREREANRWKAAAPTLVRMKTMPYEQRRAFLQHSAPMLQASGWTPEELMSFDPTDQSIDALGTAAMTVAQVQDSQKIDWHPIGERGSFATDNMGNPTGEGNPFAGGGGQSAPSAAPAQTKVLGGKTYYQTPDGKWHDSPPEGGAGSNVGGNF